MKSGRCVWKDLLTVKSTKFIDRDAGMICPPLELLSSRQ